MIGGTKGSLQFPNLKLIGFIKMNEVGGINILVNENKNKKNDSNTLVNQIDHFCRCSF